MILMSTQNLQSHSIKLSSLPLLADKGSSSVTAVKARNSVRQTGAIKQRDFVRAGVTARGVEMKFKLGGLTLALLLNIKNDQTN